MTQTFSYRDFRQACRAFKPSEFIPYLAAIGADLGQPPYPDSVRMRTPPWGLAAAARESLLYGNEYRSRELSLREIDRLMYYFNESADIPTKHDEDDGFPLALLTAITYEQFPWQESMLEELSRSHAWLVEGLSQVKTKVVNDDSLAEMMGGMPLRDAIGATFFLQVGAYKNGGVFDPRWLDQPNFAEVLDVYPRANILTTIRRLTSTRDEYKIEWDRHSTGIDHLARFDYNPLVSTPFIQLKNERRLFAPAPSLVLRTVTPGGLYYRGIAAHGQSFANDLGILFEHYIGRQLRAIDGADVYPEIAYGKGGGSKSVDWFVIMPNLVLLVEVKSKRLGPAARAGATTLVRTLRDSIHKARNQLGRTIDEMTGGNPAFQHIPTDRPIVGLIVTAEPFYTAPADLFDRGLAMIRTSDRIEDVPVAVASARDIEHLVTHRADVGRVLLDQLDTRGGGVLSIRVDARGRNPILEDAWHSYPWPGRHGRSVNDPLAL
ncbi:MULTISPECIES: NERD domain-containing protein [unclassified Rhodococcus (in: high G+C Gram-positive bacteria)]|uniref:NERD domain-containing protein n=1 Tax=unclassified Rhodococcus (in: high G+C Gram-positive bacteria) TaxID=192944 RepID=UPI00163963B3|nr:MULTISPECIES: NERD domain-containing protein [unclassified Rhodococcus (in: high G+C Gram-positive bacteria)]MBC2644766.1 NERD domain-containing protein [Rhodococcus sp. 3A]MBC2898361.1 NERD domain-containing protein [Rhodococcus sp. 4CII]